MKKFRVLITGGGTGGHIYPLVAVAAELQVMCAKSDIPLKLHYLGACGSYRPLLEANNIKVNKVALSKLRRYFSFANFVAIPMVFIGFIQALWHIFWFMPDVLFSKGGPGSLVVVFAARFYRIPVVIHESDVVPGMSNLISGKHAKVIAVSFNGAAQYFKKKTILTGNPVRSYILPKESEKDQNLAKKLMGLDPAKPLLFVSGGSQGAVRINNFFTDNLPGLLQATQILHQTGRENYETVVGQASEALKDAPEELVAGYRAVDYFERDIRDAYVASDIILARAGAGNIFEISAFGKPSILVPLPESAGDHQRLNAYEYASTGAALVIEEENMLPNLVFSTIENLLANKEGLTAMSTAAKAFFKPNAAIDLARIIMDFSPKP